MWQRQTFTNNTGFFVGVVAVISLLAFQLKQIGWCITNEGKEQSKWQKKNTFKRMNFSYFQCNRCAQRILLLLAVTITCINTHNAKKESKRKRINEYTRNGNGKKARGRERSNVAQCQLLLFCGCEEKRPFHFRIVTRTAFLLFMTHYLKVIHFFRVTRKIVASPSSVRVFTLPFGPLSLMLSLNCIAIAWYDKNQR